ncbi:hypothetical protein EBH_0084020 [Eimeria brunetti]|uniref:Uncharacterized protein n=1 Tax=Eimeria brunetti TaxID=51314 RepID=U6LM59_9EIME|nr:hypothetical protein EBH_0084020 [Eimeria brunetti]
MAPAGGKGAPGPQGTRGGRWKGRSVEAWTGDRLCTEVPGLRPSRIAGGGWDVARRYGGKGGEDRSGRVSGCVPGIARKSVSYTIAGSLKELQRLMVCVGRYLCAAEEVTPLVQGGDEGEELLVVDGVPLLDRAHDLAQEPHRFAVLFEDGPDCIAGGVSVEGVGPRRVGNLRMASTLSADGLMPAAPIAYPKSVSPCSANLHLESRG